ncbi:MAG: hypothetical protein AUH92_03190 [Acidobacteria bacterium 13_1_40CM_4_69_4]|nr:MAG: hypothetical protein AUH92_03190 [Acidobacteria bacterium 13_1_40CM_4_69_4]
MNPLYAEGMTRVRGTIKDIHGNPVAKVKIWLEAIDVKKRVGPLTTGKDGGFVIATLDISVARKWKVIPDLQGYKTVKVHYEIVDSEGNEAGSGDSVPGSKQEYPELQFKLVGEVGRNMVDLVIAKDAEFTAAVQAEKTKAQGNAAAASVSSPGGTTPATGSPEAPGSPAATVAPAEPKVSVEGLMKAKELADAGHHQEAVDMYRAYLVKDPTGKPQVYYYLGKSLFELNDDSGAEQAYRKGLELKPDMKGWHFGLGNINMRAERYTDAAEEYEKETQLEPDNDSVWFYLGRAYAKGGADDQALAALERATTINPQKSEAYMQMADIYEKRKDRRKAEEMYQKVIAVDPKNAATSFYNIGVHAWNENRDKDAVQAFQKALEIDPTNATAHREIARALTRMQDFEGAVKHYQEYLKLNPKAADAKEIQEMIVALRR